MFCDYNTGQDHLRSTGKKGPTKKSGFRAAVHVFMSEFQKEREKLTLKQLLKRQNRSKNKNMENHGKVPK